MIGLITMMVAAASAPAIAPGEPRRIAKRCHVPAESVHVQSPKLVRFMPPPDASYRKVGCVLRALQKYHVTLEMIGNRAAD